MVGATPTPTPGTAGNGAGMDIGVFCRVLFPPARENEAQIATPAVGATTASSANQTIQILDKSTVRLPVITVKKRDVAQTENGWQSKEFHVHEVFSSRDASTERVYASIGPDLVQAALKGKPATLLSYGPEKTGKSHTLFGVGHRVEDPTGQPEAGLVSRTIVEIFSKFSEVTQTNPSVVCMLQVGMIMILKNDIVVDLLDSNAAAAAAAISPNLADANPTQTENPVQVRAITREEAAVEWNVRAAGVVPQNHGPLRVGNDVVVANVSSLITTDKSAVFHAINTGVRSSRELKGDRCLVANVIQYIRGPSAPPAVTPIVIVDCSPVYSKSMHNLRDIANVRQRTNRLDTAPKSNLTRLLQHAFGSSSVLRLIVHCKVSSFDLDLFDALSSLNFASIIMKIQAQSNEEFSFPTPPTSSMGGGPDGSTPPTPAAAPNLNAMQSLNGMSGLNSAGPSPAAGMEFTFPIPNNYSQGGVPSFWENMPSSAPVGPTLRHGSFGSGGGYQRQGSAGSAEENLLHDSSPTQRNLASPVGQSQLSALIAQLKEKDMSYQKLLDSIDQYAALVQKERDKNKKLEEDLAATKRQNSQLMEHMKSKTLEGMEGEASPRATDDHAAFVESSEEEEDFVLHQNLPMGETSASILSPCRQITDEVRGENLIPVVQGGRTSPVPHRGSPVNQGMGRASPPPHVVISRTDSPATQHIHQGHDGPHHDDHDGDGMHEAVEEVQLDALGSDSSDNDSLSSGSSFSEDDDPNAINVDFEDVENALDSSSDTDEMSNAATPTPARSTSSRLSEVRRVEAQMGKLKRKHERSVEKNKKYRRLLKGMNAQLNHQAFLASQCAQKLEAEERKSQENIARAIALSTRLDETKKWVRKWKRSVQQDKEKQLPLFNEQLKSEMKAAEAQKMAQDEYKQQMCDQQNQLMRELQAKNERLESLEAMVQALGSEYNRKLSLLVTQSGEWEAFLEAINPDSTPNGATWQTQMMEAARQRYAEEHGEEAAELLNRENLAPIHMQLKLENELLRSNMQGMMQVVEHCYGENARLSNLAARLTRSLSETNERMQAYLQQKGDDSSGGHFDGSSAAAAEATPPRGRMTTTNTRRPAGHDEEPVLRSADAPNQLDDVPS